MCARVKEGERSMEVCNWVSLIGNACAEVEVRDFEVEHGAWGLDEFCARHKTLYANRSQINIEMLLDIKVIKRPAAPKSRMGAYQPLTQYLVGRE